MSNPPKEAPDVTVYIGSFGEGSYALGPQLVKQVWHLAQQVKAGPYTKVHLTGYTDNVFTPAFGAVVTEKRALSVKVQLEADLARLGVRRVQITVAGATPVEAIALNTTVRERARNRHVIANLRAS